LLPNINSPIELIGTGYHVAELVAQLQNPDVWNRHPMRLYGPHSKLSDIWVRFRDSRDLVRPENYAEPHESVWYPVVKDIPAVLPLVDQVMRAVNGAQLGGVLITKIPPHEICKPHRDTGWHAETYEKFAVQLAGNLNQGFCFEDKELRTMPGDLYTFDNSRVHWVVNNSHEDRITLIMCIRRSH